MNLTVFAWADFIAGVSAIVDVLMLLAFLLCWRPVTKMRY
jgi:hypothetical protein